MEQKHSGLGIASIIINIISCIFIILQVKIPGSVKYEVIDLLIPLFMSLVAFGIGLGGLIQKDRKKLFAIFGTIFSLVPIVYSGGLLLFFWVMDTLVL